MAFIFILWLITIEIIYKKCDKKLYALPVIFSGFWFIMSLVAYILTKNYYKFNILSFFIIYLICLFYSIGYLLFNKANICVSSRRLCKIRVSQKQIVLFQCSITFLALLYPVLVLRNFNFSIGNLFSLSKILTYSNYVSIMRYTNEPLYNTYISGGFLNVFLIFSYLCPLIGGYTILKYKNKKNKFVSLLSLLSPFLTLIATNSKTGLLSSVFLFFAGMLVTMNEDSKKITKKIIIWSIIVIILLLFILFVSMIFRTGEYGDNIVEQIKIKFITYGFASFSAFDNWLINSQKEPYTFGRYTFYSIFNLLGIATRKQGVYDLIGEGVVKTNVFTMFRGNIQDFGIIGTFLLYLFFGFISAYSKNKFCKNSSPLAGCILALAIFTIFYGIIISPLTFSSYMFSFLIFFVFLIFDVKEWRHVN